MKLLLFCSLFIVFISEGLGLGYHQDVGIPEAARIRLKEARQMSSRIIGGMPSQTGDNPHLAGLLISLTTGQMSVCSGTLLSSRKVLTAAQCWYDGYSQGKSIQVTLGSVQLFYGSRFDVSGISVHPGFDPRKLNNDLAMLTLRYAVGSGYNIMPAILPPPGFNISLAGFSARVSGYGKTSDWSSVGPETVQNAVSVTVSENWWDCVRNLPQQPDNSNNVICTKGENGWGSCGGDLGGPLVLENWTEAGYYYNGTLLIGVISIQSPFGCQTGFATGYSRVTSFLDWIQRNM